MDISLNKIKTIAKKYFEQNLAPPDQLECRQMKDFSQHAFVELQRWLQEYPKNLSDDELTSIIHSILSMGEGYANILYQKKVLNIEICRACQDYFKNTQLLHLF